MGNSRPTHVPAAVRAACPDRDGHRCVANLLDGECCPDARDRKPLTSPGGHRVSAPPSSTSALSGRDRATGKRSKRPPHPAAQFVVAAYQYPPHMADGSSIAEVVADKVVDVGVGVGTTFLGILLVYVLTRPNVMFGDCIQVSRRRDGRDRFRVLVNNGSYLFPIVELRVMARLVVYVGVRGTAIPVPLSRDSYFDVRRSRASSAWFVEARLRMSDVDWNRYLPPDYRRPSRPRDLAVVLDELEARLVVTTVAVSSIFGTTRVQSRSYFARDMKPAEGSYVGPQRRELLDRLRDWAPIARLGRSARRARPPR